MPKIQLAVYDKEKEYVAALVNYILEHKGNEMDVSAFTQEETLLAYGRKNKPDIFLLSAEDVCETTDEVEAGIRIFLADGQIDEKYEACPCIHKYQAADEILRAIYRYYEELEMHKGIWVQDKSSRMRMIYAPGKTMYQTPFALTLAAMVAVKKSVLYLNLCENVAFEWMFQRHYEQDLSHFIYLMKREKHSVKTILSGIVYEMKGVALVAPMRNGMDRSSLSAEEWVVLLEQLKYQSGYEEIILETDFVLPGFFELLQLCDELYLPGQNHPYEQARRQQFMEWLENGMPETMNIIPVILPSMTLPFSGENILGQWMFTKMGDLVRTYAEQ